MSCDPAQVSRAPEHIIIMVVKHVLERRGSVQHVASLGVQNALRLSR